MNIGEIMLKTSGILNKNLIDCISINELKISELMLNVEVIQEWSKIENELECSKMLKEVCYDLLTSMYFVSFGLYRNAFISLRSALELGMGFVYFVDRNYNYLLWKKDSYDIKWCDLSDIDNGVLSNNYLKLFHDSNYDTFIKVAKELYGECSEYVHGKHDYMQTLDGLSIEYNSEKFDKWYKTFKRITEILIVLLTVRFNNKVEFIDEDKLITIKEILNKYELREVAVSDAR